MVMHRAIVNILEGITEAYKMMGELLMQIIVRGLIIVWCSDGGGYNGGDRRHQRTLW